MKERAQELKAAARANKNKADGESDVLAKIAEMEEPDRAMATRLHEIIKASAPALAPKTWYGMPTYAKDGKVICFFQAASKFNTRYATFGFQHDANLDDGDLWPTAFALKALSIVFDHWRLSRWRAADALRYAAAEDGYRRISCVTGLGLPGALNARPRGAESAVPQIASATAL